MTTGMDPDIFEQFIEQLHRYVRDRLIPAAREIIYGMDYKTWQAANQKDATPEQKAAFAAAMAKHG